MNIIDDTKSEFVSLEKLRAGDTFRFMDSPRVYLVLDRVVFKQIRPERDDIRFPVAAVDNGETLLIVPKMPVRQLFCTVHIIEKVVQ